VNGNIQTPSLIIEQGAVFEGSCKMLQMSAAADKSRKEKKDDQPLDASKMQPMAVDSGKRADVASVSNVSSVVS